MNKVSSHSSRFFSHPAAVALLGAVVGSLITVAGQYFLASKKPPPYSYVVVSKLPTRIALNKGWNLIGYTCQETRAIEDVLAPIKDDVIVVNAFEGSAKSYDPKLPEFSDLREFKYGRGYWIKMRKSAVLVLRE